MTTGSPDADLAGDGPSHVVFMAQRVDHPDATKLLGAFFQEQIDRYGFAESVDLDPEVYAEPNGIFVVIYLDGSPVGCGGCRRFDPGSATFEIKKTYLVPEARGRGLGRQLLEVLERAATARGARRIILETGVRNIAALGLFTGSGYTSMPRYVPGRDPKINRAFEKTLSDTSSDLRPDDVQQATV